MASPLALDLDAVLGDTRPLWHEWLQDAARRLRLDELDLPEDRVAAAAELDGRVGNWQVLLERFADDRASIYFRPNADVSATLRRLETAGVSLGAFTDAPEPLARIALEHLGAARRLAAWEAGPDALERLLVRLGPGTTVLRTRAELLSSI